MILIVCIDKKNGMMFNKRRQSQDRVVRERILTRAAGSKLWMSGYSAKQFAEEAPGADFIVDEDCVTKAGVGEYCFVEDKDFSLEHCEQVILYHWNRQYPGDTFFKEDLKASGYRKVSETEFTGYSHEKITEQIYSRK